jgi:nucleotide-binding universal stress UspA family protein
MAQRDADCPVLFAYDGSDQAKTAIHEAARQLNRGRRGIVLTVWQPIMSRPFAANAAAWGMALEEDDMAAEATRLAEEGATLARSVGFDATPLATSRNPVWHGIVASAADHDAGIVVMGSHGRTGIGLALIGSVAMAVARHTDRPVLIVHSPPASDAA